MDMEGALRARLIAAAPVTALVGQRIYWVERPQSSALPAITLQIIDDPVAQHMKGIQGMQSTLVQIDAWASSYGSANAIKDAVIAALLPANTSNGVKFGRAFVRTRDLSERTETQFFFRQSMDFTINHASA